MNKLITLLRSLEVPKVVIAILVGILCGIFVFFDVDIQGNDWPSVVTVTETAEVPVTPTSADVTLPEGFECICYN